MRNEYTGLRKWCNWGAMFLVLCVFAIDTGLGNVYKVVGSEDYVTQVYQYVSFKEIFGLMPYCLLMIIASGESFTPKFSGSFESNIPLNSFAVDIVTGKHFVTGKRVSSHDIVPGKHRD